MNSSREAATRAFERVLDMASAEKRQLDAWECLCLRAALLMMAMNDNGAALRVIENCERVPRGLDVNRQPTFTIDDMRTCLAMLTSELPH